MAVKESQSAAALVGRRVDDLSLSERRQYANKWVAFRLYTPPEKVTRDGVEYVDVRVKKVEAAGNSMGECAAALRRQNLNPSEFEFTILKQPY